ncbi:MAG: hypothetical protein F9K47_03740 [Burkholderiales bacterium]|nr:MAG: hypothetical protein F9K47_03740 [Burkholderiales bacterium]CAG0966903.1 hypothetical protein MYXO_01077 [Myxococcaceae bacterium]
MKANRVVAICATLLVAAAQASPPSVNPEGPSLEAETIATITKEKSKKSTIAEGVAASTDRKNQGSQQNCGQVNINSNTNQDRKSVSGMKDMFGKQSTTIVTGPVINMANCK